MTHGIDSEEQRLQFIRDRLREIGESIFWCWIVPIACFVIGWICGADGAMEYAEKRGFDWDSPVVKQEDDQ